MIARLPCLLMTVLSGVALSQAPPAVRADLEPIESSLTYHTPAYHLQLREILMRKGPARCDVQFMVLPSFQPETLLSIYEVKDGFEAQVVKPGKQIWEALHEVRREERTKPLAIECTGTKAIIPGPVAARVTKLWRSMLLRTRYSTADGVHLDGVSYLFFSWEQRVGDMGGEANNPSEGTRAFVLAEIGNCLVSYVEAEPEKRAELLLRLAKEMDRLELLLAATGNETSAPPAEKEPKRKGA